MGSGHAKTQPAPRERSLVISAGLCILLVAGMAWLRLGVFGRITLPVGYAVPVIITGWTRRRRLLWGIVAAFAAITILKFGYLLNRTEPHAVTEHLWSGAAVLVDLFLTGLIVDLLFKSHGKLADTLSEVEDERWRLKTVVEAVPFGVLIVNVDATVGQFNPAGAALLGVPREIRGPSISWTSVANFFHDGNPVPPERYPIRRALDGEHAPLEEYENRFHDGRRLTLLVSASPIRDRFGSINSAVAAFVDVTELKRLQQELDRRRRDAEQDSVSKSRFLAAVSHDIRTPANAISLLAELIQRAVEDPAAGEVRELARELQNCSLGLVSMVGDALDLARLDLGKVVLKPQKFDLGQWFCDECAKLRPLADAKKLSFQCLPPQRAVRVFCDQIKLGRVLANLVSNAVKYTESGQVHVCAERLGDGSVRLAVQDTGIGIADEDMSQIFDEFFQLKNPERDRTKGTGLGLSISKRLVEAMGGRITIESLLGRGSTFAVILPASVVVG
ncbi:MAG: PAS domain-containing sensor histidine kinase [Tepidisphaeraceae bacterium]|jgi:PAS domain S-box-containing protein